jgi:hypothetical protein
MSFSVLLGALKKKHKKMSKKIESPYFVFFCEKRKSIGIMKKISCVDFLLKKEKKKSVFFCGVLFREDSFRDIVREKKTCQ